MLTITLSSNSCLTPELFPVFESVLPTLYTISWEWACRTTLSYVYIHAIKGPVHFDENGIRNVNKLRVLQYRATYVNGTPIHCDGSLSQRLNLVDVAYVERENEGLHFVIGSKADIWPGYNFLPYMTLYNEIYSLYIIDKIIFHMMVSQERNL